MIGWPGSSSSHGTEHHVDYQTSGNLRPGFKWSQLIQNYTQRCRVVITRPFQLKPEHKNSMCQPCAEPVPPSTMIEEEKKKCAFDFKNRKMCDSCIYGSFAWLCRPYIQHSVFENDAHVCVCDAWMWTDRCCLGLCIQDRVEESRSQRETAPGYEPHCLLEG